MHVWRLIEIQSAWMPSEHIYELLRYMPSKDDGTLRYMFSKHDGTLRYMLSKYIHVSQNLGLTAHKIGYREEE
jgi:hypothetical protein